MPRSINSGHALYGGHGALNRHGDIHVPEQSEAPVRKDWQWDLHRFLLRWHLRRQLEYHIDYICGNPQ